jgi:hypothetical protein
VSPRAKKVKPFGSAGFRSFLFFVARYLKALGSGIQTPHFLAAGTFDHQQTEKPPQSVSILRQSAEDVGMLELTTLAVFH